MKYLFIVAAMLLGLGTVTSYAQTQGNETVAVATTDEYKNIEVKELPQAVQDAVAKDYADYTIKQAAVKTAEDSAKLYKLTLADKEDKTTEVVFNEKGEVQK